MDLDKILQSASDRLFPEELGEARITIDSKSSDGDTALHVFIWGKETEKAISLIEHGADINAAGDMGETPLHAAIKQGNREVIYALMAANADVNIKSEFGETPATLAEKSRIKLEKNT